VWPDVTRGCFYLDRHIIKELGWEYTTQIREGNMKIRKLIAALLAAVLVTFAGLATAGAATYDEPDTAYDLSGKVGIDQSRYHVRYMVFDFERDDVYMTTWETGFCGLFLLMRYNIAEDTVDNNLNGGSARCQRYPYVWNMNSLEFDFDTDTIFGASRASYWAGLHKYDIEGGTFQRAITGSSMSAGMPRSPVYDSDGKAIYFGTSRWDGAGGDFFRYHVPTGAKTNLTYKLIALWGGKSGSKNDIYALAYDSSSKVVYVAGNQGKLARYNTPLYTYGTHTSYPSPDTAYTVSLSSTSWGSHTVHKLLYVPSEHAVYLGGNSGRFAVLEDDGAGNISVVDLSSAISSALGTNSIYALAYGNGNIFIGASYGKFLQYNTSSGEVTDLSDRIASFWGTNAVQAVVYDFNNDVVYLGGSYGRLARYNPVSVIEATVDVDPDTLNRKSRSAKNAVTVYIEMPDHDVALVDLTSVTLNTANGSVSAQLAPSSVGDHDGDGIADLMVKFNRQDVAGIVEAGDAMEVTISGSIDGMTFEGSDVIRVIE
jgi:hypothetical protein